MCGIQSKTSTVILAEVGNTPVWAAINLEMTSPLSTPVKLLIAWPWIAATFFSLGWCVDWGTLACYCECKCIHNWNQTLLVLSVLSADLISPELFLMFSVSITGSKIIYSEILYLRKQGIIIGPNSAGLYTHRHYWQTSSQIQQNNKINHRIWCLLILLYLYSPV